MPKIQLGSMTARARCTYLFCALLLRYAMYVAASQQDFPAQRDHYNLVVRERGLYHSTCPAEQPTCTGRSNIPGR